MQVDCVVILGYSQFIRLIELQVLRHVYREAEVSTTVETCFFTVDKDCGFIIYSSKVEQYLLTLPRRRYFEGCRKPRVQSPIALDPCRYLLIFDGNRQSKTYRTIHSQDTTGSKHPVQALARRVAAEQHRGLQHFGTSTLR